MTAHSVQHAPGKVILIGEHAVLRGHPAIAASIPPGLTLIASLEQSPNTGTFAREALTTAAAFFGLDPGRVRLRIRSTLPVGAGLGSSAALSVALVRALADLCHTESSPQEVLRMATRVEDAFHGRSSGLDIHAVAADGPIWFEPGPEPRASALKVGEPLDLVVALSGRNRSTATQTRSLADPRDSGLVSATMARLGVLTGQARAAAAGGDLRSLGDAMNHAHEELSALGLSTPALDRMVGLARAAGAVGAKLTGAGRGGATVALSPGHTAQVVTALRAAGFDAFTVRMGQRR